jgi:hypothetical protein
MKKPALFAATFAAALLLGPVAAHAHCDAMDGPVLVTARKALETGKLNPVLAWVPAADEKEIEAVFKHTLAVRKLGPEARALADRFFFETLVRVHRAGEGAPFTGIKPAGQDPGPAVRAADKAIETGSLAEVDKLLTETVRKRVAASFHAVKSKKTPGEDVAAGREWVAAYVPFVHLVEGIYSAAQAGAGHEHHTKVEAAAPATCGHTRAAGHDAHQKAPHGPAAKHPPHAH